jgi:predicted flap endonuclease-1-like 5' DNA nuclease
MAAKKSVTLEDLAKHASDFVTLRNGAWDHEAWTDFVASLKKKGFDISEEMQANLGQLLEAMKRFYAAAAATDSVKNSMSTIVKDSVAFIKRQKGVWGHPEWEEFLQTMERNALRFGEGTTAYLGGILESIKVFYSTSPEIPEQQSAPRTAPTPSSAATSETSSASKPSAVAKAVSPGGSKPAPAEKSPSGSAPKPSPAAKPAPVAQTGVGVKPTGAQVEKKPSAQKAVKKDDLTAIAGIGPVLAKKLNAAGIVGYAQLAAISEEQIADLEKNVIKLKGRIKRDDWVGQAKKLSQA